MPEPGRATPPSGHLSVGPDSGDRPLPLFVERRETRLGSALGVSIAIHAVAFVLLILIGRLVPAADPFDGPPDSPLPQLVWIPAEGPGGGGGGGGNETPEPPAQVQCVVGPDGTVSDLEVIRSLDQTFGLDDQALRAARQWLFEPATLRGEPVAVRVLIQLDFALR